MAEISLPKLLLCHQTIASDLQLLNFAIKTIARLRYVGLGSEIARLSMQTADIISNIESNLLLKSKKVATEINVGILLNFMNALANWF